jgi:hypothetical protein
VPYDGAAPLSAVVIDPGHAALLEGDLLDDARGGAGVLAPRVLELGAFGAAALLHAVAP